MRIEHPISVAPKLATGDPAGQDVILKFVALIFIQTGQSRLDQQSHSFNRKIVRDHTQ